MSTPSTITSTTRRLSQGQVDVLKSLTPGQRIRVVQTVRVGAKKWQAVVDGVFRHINYLATGVTTDRVPEDDIVVPVVHFTKDSGELTSISMDENTVVERTGDPLTPGPPPAAPPAGGPPAPPPQSA